MTQWRGITVLKYLPIRVRRMKAAVVDHAPKNAVSVWAFDQATNDSFLAFVRSGVIVRRESMSVRLGTQIDRMAGRSRPHSLRFHPRGSA